MRLNYNLVMIYVVVNDEINRSSSFLIEEWAASITIYIYLSIQYPNTNLEKEASQYKQIHIEYK